MKGRRGIAQTIRVSPQLPNAPSPLWVSIKGRAGGHLAIKVARLHKGVPSVQAQQFPSLESTQRHHLEMGGPGAYAARSSI